VLGCLISRWPCDQHREVVNRPVAATVALVPNVIWIMLYATEHTWLVQ